jgi:hypothetical protein
MLLMLVDGLVVGWCIGVWDGRDSDIEALLKGGWDVTVLSVQSVCEELALPGGGIIADVKGRARQPFVHWGNAGLRGRMSHIWSSVGG